MGVRADMSAPSQVYEFPVHHTPHIPNIVLSAGYFPETDEQGNEKWPRGDKKVWEAGTRGLDKVA